MLKNNGWAVPWVGGQPYKAFSAGIAVYQRVVSCDRSRTATFEAFDEMTSHGGRRRSRRDLQGTPGS